MDEHAFHDAFRPPKVETEVLGNDTPFYVVGRFKYFFLYFSTAGLYLLPWFYLHFRWQKVTTGRAIWPVPRAIFSVFYLHDLFRDLAKAATLGDKSLRKSATAYVVLSLLALPSVRFEAFALLAILAFLLSPFPLWKAQKAANAAAEDPQGQTNSSLRWWQWFVVTPALIFLALMFVGFVILATKTQLNGGAPEP